MDNMAKATTTEIRSPIIRLIKDSPDWGLFKYGMARVTGVLLAKADNPITAKKGAGR
jgi:hypothetical protein